MEQHLVNMRNRRALAIVESKDEYLAEKISQWFDGFNNNLKYLLEDPTAELKFNTETLKFTILQDCKPEYSFQSLSSGYQAIFEIYSDLLMHTEYFGVAPGELTGLVFIDELDAHLHVSLQRLIFPFLVKSFPCVQFVVTTHSPFVLMSIDDAVIYDLTKNSQVDEDVSMYSHTAVIQGLLGTKATSVLLDDMIREISTIISSRNIDFDRLRYLVGKIGPHREKLDNKSKSYFILGETALLDQEE